MTCRAVARLRHVEKPALRGLYVMAAGLAAVLVAPVWSESTPDADGANIGAGLLWLAGWAILIAGGLLLAYDLLAWPRRRDDE
jgi:hypothetical protein